MKYATTKNYLLLLVPYLTVLVVMAVSWKDFVFAGYAPRWQHTAAVVGFLIVTDCLEIKFDIGLIALGCFLVLGTFNVFSFTTGIHSFWIISDKYCPRLQPESLGILVIYGFCNFDVLVEIYLDYKEAR